MAKSVGGLPRAVLAACVLASLVGSAACRAPKGAGRDQLALRLIAEDPAETYDRRAISRAATVFEWTFRDQQSLTPWRSANFNLHAALGEGRLRVRFARPDPALRPHIARAVDLDTAAIDAVEVEAAGPRRDFRSRGALQLYWSGPGEGFSDDRSISVPAVQEVGAYRATYSFEVARHPLWRGRLAGLRLDPTSAGDDSVDVRSIRGVKHQADPVLMTAASARPWKVDLAGDLRPARTALPGHPLEWRLEIPPRSTLRFSYGVSEAARMPVAFRVSLVRAAAEPALLFESAIQPPAEQVPPAWHEARVDLARFAGAQGTLLFEARPEAAFDPSRAVAAWGQPSIRRARDEPQPPNVILVSLDTLRADRIAATGPGAGRAPNIDRWARARAAVFERAVASSPWTLPSHTSIFTGLDALRHGVNHGYPVPRSIAVAAALFQRAGYATAGITGGGYVGPEYGFDRGFDSYYSQRGLEAPGEMERGVERCLRFLSQAPEPFLLFFHTYAIHAFARQHPDSLYAQRPDEVRSGDGYRVRYRFVSLAPGGAGVPAGPAELAGMARLYDESVAYADQQVGRLLRELEALDLDGRTIVVVTSDHGEALGEKGLAGHAYLYDFNLLVPLLVAAPDGRGAGRRVPAQVRSVDILPTLLELAGLPPLPAIDGRSLVPLMLGRPEAEGREAWSYAASTNFGLSLRSASQLKLLFNNTAWRPACGDQALYRLPDDPREERSLPASSEEAQRLRDRVLHALRTRSNGLLVEFFNAGGTAFAGTIDAPFLHQNRVKTPGPACGEVSWNTARGGIDFRVAPGQPHRLILEGVGPGALGLTLDSGGQRFQAKLQPPELAEPWQVALDGSSWQASRRPGGSPATGVRIQWAGQVQIEGPLPAESDAALRQRLKALGYVQ